MLYSQMAIEQMCLIIFLGFPNATYFILNTTYSVNFNKTKKNTCSRANLKYPICPCKQEVTTFKFDNMISMWNRQIFLKARSLSSLNSRKQKHNNTLFQEKTWNVPSVFMSMKWLLVKFNFQVEVMHEPSNEIICP